MENTFIKAVSNKTYTENGALTNKSTQSALLDFYFHGAALRRDSGVRTIELFENAFKEDKTKALKILFYIRDVRGGQGERETFRKILKWLGENESDWIKNNLGLIPEYGRWDDLGALLKVDAVKDYVIQFLVGVYLLDLKHIENNEIEKVSLLGKWLWSENATKKETKELAKILINSKLFGSAKQYRKNLVLLRKIIGIVETKLCNKEYDNIDYSKLPSLSLLKYRKAFERNDNAKYSKYLESVNKGEVKINTKTLYPYDIVRAYDAHKDLWCIDWDVSKDETLETQWKNLPDYVPAFNGLVVSDTSGSMSGDPMNVSISLAIYIAERNKSEVWKNYCIPFSSNAHFIEVKGETLLNKIKSVYTGDCSNTNLQAVFDLILGRAVACKVKPEDMPETLLIISDMEFDSCDNWNLNLEVARKKYSDAGYEVPRLVWWNVDSRNTQTPATTDDNGNVLISGCSPVALKIALNPELGAIEVMEETINQKRYDLVKY